MPAQRIAGRYEVVRPLGEGPLGKVYHVLDHGESGEPSGGAPAREATLKILRADALDYDRLESSLAELGPRLTALRAPGINPLEHIGRTPLGLLFLASGFAPGENLHTLLARRGPLPPDRVGAIARGILTALAAAHEAGIPHGDLHPGNVLLRDGAPYTVVDPFGTSVLLLDHGTLALVGARRPASLAPYVAPELQPDADREEPEATAAGDVFAVGAILLSLLTGRTDATPEEVPDAWREFLLSALAEDPDERPSDAAAMLALVPKADTAAASPSGGNGAMEELGERLQAAEKRAADAEQELDKTLSTTFTKLVERDAALGELRAARDADKSALEAARTAAEEARRSAEKAVAARDATRDDAETARREAAQAKSDAAQAVAARGTAAEALAAAEAELQRREKALESVKTELGVLRSRNDEQPRESGSDVEKVRSALVGARVLAAALAVLAIVTGVMWWQERNTSVQAAPSEEVAAPDPALLARAESAERELEAARAMNAQQAERNTALLVAREEEAALLAAEIEALRETDRGLRGELEQSRIDLATAQEAATQAALTMAEQGDEIADAQTRLGELEVELSRARDPELFALDQLDRVLDALAEDDGRAARARYQSMLVTNPDLDGLAGLDRLTAAALRLEEADEATDLLDEIDRRIAAREALAAADTGAPALVDAAWVHKEGDRRAEAIDSALERIQSRHALARVAFDNRLDTRWRAILNESPDVDPREPSALAAWFDDGRMQEFLAWKARYLRDTLSPGGLLEVPTLLKLRHLDAWADLVAADPELASSVDGREILVYRFARQWRNAPSGSAPQAPEGLFDGDVADDDGWRADLRLRAELCGPRAAWPGGVGSKFLYHVAAVVDGEVTVTWQLDEVLSSHADVWRLRRTFHRVDGSFLSEVEVTIDQVGKRFLEAQRPGGPLFDAASERAYRVVFEPGEDATPPSALLDAAEHIAFRDALRAAEEEAMAYESQGLTSWFSPRYGLLAIESPGSFRRELAWAAPLPR